MEFNRQPYIDAIIRELDLRKSAYPKIAKRKEQKWLTELKELKITPGLTEEDMAYIQGKVLDLVTAQRIQYELLEDCLKLYQTNTRSFIAPAIFAELEREYIMRCRVYPRLILFKRLTIEQANAELLIWKSLCTHFKETFL